jgi:hypothetical protein
MGGLSVIRYQLSGSGFALRIVGTWNDTTDFVEEGGERKTET